MNDDKFLSIYNKLREESIGNTKRCNYKSKGKIQILKRAFLSITALLCCAGAVGCNKINEQPKSIVESESQSFESSDLECNGYQYSRILTFSKIRSKELLDNNGLTEYYFDTDSLTSIYSYTATDYEKIDGLDESYIFGFYNLSDHNTVDEVCKALGYEGFYDYLNTNDLGSEFDWRSSEVYNTSLLMKERDSQEKKVK